ncbi:MAG: hypothetical protein A2751_01040 [Candidatus Doudnabacteria bacterium RIFCSPHIGHO2_01_FULL_46_14]|uniref:Nudix hydrolase domain-containing protein n=1 Tax=Candidatus Doudnabacteria bacterium RIFCSPHIGHO2_01_FULL_46_14 TaxID=1817824 RepID=A0A1F5NN01_9BACT|nr:MAG: hypothetical protein A2751_01040 [Candidatus Doudnabacteria bacterium RIFCSPHIGHO2_01_FULL_46_14]
MVLKDGKVLLGKRKGAHGEGQYAPPGGGLDNMESFEQCARREVREETGMEIDNLRFLSLSNLKTYPPAHFVNIGIIADWKSGEPQNLEPDKSEDWAWYDLDNLPHPLFANVPIYLEAIRTKKYFFDN